MLGMLRVPRPKELILIALIGCDPGIDFDFGVSALDTIQPPSSLSAPSSSTSGNVNVHWGPSPTSGVDQYELQYSTDGEKWTPSYQGRASTPISASS
jgi:hypothetical protein